MNQDPLQLTPAQATALVQRHIDPGLTVTAVRKLYGGSINRVVELTTDGEPAAIVAKLNHPDKAQQFWRERGSLDLYARQTRLPVPGVLATIDPDPEAEHGYTGAGLLLEKAPGVILADARLSDRGRRRFEEDLARRLIELHSHHRHTFGSALAPDRGVDRWLDNFRPRLEQEFVAVRDHLSTPARNTIEDVLERLDRWLPERATPTLVHGDLWANNILVDDRHPDRPHITAFIDGSAAYCDPEYELAYLRVFHTAGTRFFECYGRHHRLREGFERRCRVYWLHTLLTHVRTFGGQYVRSCEDLTRQIAKAG